MVGAEGVPANGGAATRPSSIFGGKVNEFALKKR